MLSKKTPAILNKIIEFISKLKLPASLIKAIKLYQSYTKNIQVVLDKIKKLHQSYRRRLQASLGTFIMLYQGDIENHKLHLAKT